MLGTLGHHDNWQYADQTIDTSNTQNDNDNQQDTEESGQQGTEESGQQDTEKSGQQDTEESGQQGTNGSGPGLTVGTALLGVSGVGYLLKRRLDNGE